MLQFELGPASIGAVVGTDATVVVWVYIVGSSSRFSGNSNTNTIWELLSSGIVFHEHSSVLKKLHVRNRMNSPIEYVSQRVHRKRRKATKCEHL